MKQSNVRRKVNQMTNVDLKKDGNILTIKIDLSQEHGPSKSGKTITIASTKGNVEVAPGIKLGLNCYKGKTVT